MYCIGVSVRLVGGSSYNEGRVEVNYNGEWGTVCDDGWDDTDAGIVCRQLGFGSYGSSYGGALFSQGSGPIWLDNIACIGTESTIASCGHLGFNITRYCNHYEDAGVKCYGGQGMTLFIYIPCQAISTCVLYIYEGMLTTYVAMHCKSIKRQ